MHEIDPQSGDPLEEGRLTEALRRMAASSRQGAPAEIGSGLVTAFRRHHIRRRRIRRAGVALAACIALVAGLVSMRMLRRAPHAGQVPAAASSMPGKIVNRVTAPNVVTAQARPAEKHTRPKAVANRAASSRQFLALPGYDPAVPADELHVVRVQLPESALWQMGAPVNPGGGGRRVLADFVVSQDGTPYAVRLVQ
jgi:hypothetical protein